MKKLLTAIGDKVDMQSLSIRTKLALGYGTVFLVFFTTIFLFLFNFTLVNMNYTKLSENNLPITISLQELAYRASRVNSSFNEFLFDLSFRDEAEDADGEIEEIIENAEALGEEIERYSLLLNQQGLSEKEEFISIMAIGRDFIAQT